MRIADEMFPELSDQEIAELVTNVAPKDRKLITASVDYSVSTIVDLIRDGGIVIPEFQRNYVWSERKASRLIESLIMQCPVPVVYFSRRVDGVLEVVDGNQRLTSLRRFVDGHFPLTGLTAFPELLESKYDDLDPRFQRHILSKTIRCVIIEPESHPQIKFDVFERLNSGSTPLNPQELRHGIYAGDFMRALGTFAKSHDLIRLTGVKNNSRMKRDELVLRYLAFSNNIDEYEKPLSDFLNRFAGANRDAEPWVTQGFGSSLDNMLLKVEFLLGDKPFRFRADERSAPKFNVAYFDAISVGLARSALIQMTPNDLIRRNQAAVARLAELQQSEDFRQYVLKATSDETAVISRIIAVRDAFNSVA